MSPPQMPTHGAHEAGEGVARLQEEDRGAERERGRGGRQRATVSYYRGGSTGKQEEAAAGATAGDANRTERGEERGGRKMVGPTFRGGFGGPPRLEGERRDLEGYAKWRLV
jgi:hypothetical protein